MEPGRLTRSAVVALALLVSCTTTTSPSPSALPTASPTATAQPTPSQEPSEIVIPSGPDALRLVSITADLQTPVGIAFPPDGSRRLAIIERGGLIRWIDANGTLAPSPLLDISALVRAGGEQGLLGLAFHPDFAINGRFVVDYTRRPDGATVVAEYTADATRTTADPASTRTLLTVEQPASNHNGGGLAFGPDGYLYIALGDGGGANDQYGNGQNPDSLLAKILRIDVDGPPSAGEAYAIPPDNPWADGGGVPEMWAYGLRNPWRFSFDRDWGDLYIGDVGQNAWEEIDRQAADHPGGANYGWPVLEGRHCFRAAACDPTNLVMPIAEYSHELGCAVIGGQVYRGTAQPALVGVYVFADACSGILFTLQVDEGTTVPKIVMTGGPDFSAFGEDEAGEIYVVALNGMLYRVVVPDA